MTTPPLAQCVKWVVFKNPLEVSAAQVYLLKHLPKIIECLLHA